MGTDPITLTSDQFLGSSPQPSGGGVILSFVCGRCAGAPREILTSDSGHIGRRREINDRLGAFLRCKREILGEAECVMQSAVAAIGKSRVHESRMQAIRSNSRSRKLARPFMAQSSYSMASPKLWEV